jgi:hypothetical protein
VIEANTHQNLLSCYGATAVRRTMLESAAIEVAANNAQNFGGGIHV